MNSQRRDNLRRLLRPRHVAFVGGRGVAEAVRQCLAAGFSGAVWPVHPTLTEIAGLPCFRDVDALPAPPDASFIAVPSEPTIEVVRALARRGAGGCVCYAAGFAEIGEAGRQRRLVEAAGALALVGPNCYGLLNNVQGVVLWPSGHGGRRTQRGVALVAQSGNIALNLTLNRRSVPLSHVISVGNQAVLGIADFVSALAEDPAVAAIALYIEGLPDIAAFAAAAAEARAAGIPIVVLKAGRSALGAALALSHTSSLAGDDALYQALFDRLGVLRVDSLPALLETAKLLAVAGRPRGERLAIFTCSGGECLLAADRAAALGLTLPGFSPAQAAALREQLPAFATVANPLDYNTSLWNDEAALTRCFSTVLAEGFDAGLLVIDYPAEDATGREEYDPSVAALIAAARATGTQGMVVSVLPELLPEAVRDRLVDAGMAPLQGLEEAMAAFAAAARLERRWAAADALPALPPAAPIEGGRRMLDEWQSKRLLAEHGLVLPAGRLVAPVEAVAAARAIGFPVVAKIARPAIAHKTEAGAVALDLRDEGAVSAAVTRMELAAGLSIEQLLIERQVTGAVAELIVGVKRDAAFGLALVIGAGGVLVEMVADSATLLLPTTAAAIAEALAGLRVARLLQGYRGRPAGDVTAAVRAIAAIAAAAEALGDRLVELDVNPLLVLPAGQGAVAVDALIVLAA